MTFKSTYLFFIFCFIFSLASFEAQTGNLDEEFKNKNPETKLTEVVAMDSIMGAELAKRANVWLKLETPKYKKTSGSASNGKIECEVSFLIKAKELNPRIDVTGKITMKVVLDCKDNKYRYTVSQITHISKTGTTNGGNIDNIVPDCGSAAMDDVSWKKVKGEALRNAAMVVTDIKDAMVKPSAESAADHW